MKGYMRIIKDLKLIQKSEEGYKQNRGQQNSDEACMEYGRKKLATKIGAEERVEQRDAYLVCGRDPLRMSHSLLSGRNLACHDILLWYLRIFLFKWTIDQHYCFNNHFSRQT